MDEEERPVPDLRGANEAGRDWWHQQQYLDEEELTMMGATPLWWRVARWIALAAVAVGLVGLLTGHS